MVTLECLKREWSVLKPIGDRLPYDLVLDVNGTLVKIQVKSAWYSNSSQNHVVDNRRTKTNRRKMVRSNYTMGDFDFAVAYIADPNRFYVFPIETLVSFGSEIQLVESSKRQRKPRSSDFREAWHLIEQWASYRETDMRTSVKFGEACNVVIPSQASEKSEEGVET